jgi:hypothetical protein
MDASRVPGQFLRAALFASVFALHGAPAARSATEPASPPAEPIPHDAVDAILQAFERVPVVALGMSHRQQDESDFVLRLVRDPRFASHVNTIVIEAGNALYQPDLDRYVAGQAVPIERVRRVWRDTTQPGSADVRGSSELLETVREVNRHLPAAHRVRVLAGDPPIDWSQVHRLEDYLPFGTGRDVHFASTVVSQVLAKHRKALLVIGAAHVMRRPVTWPGDPRPVEPTVTMRIEQSFPNSVFVVIPHDDFGARNAELEPRLASWPVPSLSRLGPDWIGMVDAGAVFGGKIRRVGSDPSHPEAPYPGVKLRDLADGYLYLGPIASIREVERIRESGTPYARELARRLEILGGGAVAAPLPRTGH